MIESGMAKHPARDVRGLPTTAQLFSRLRRRDKRNCDVMDREIEALCVRELTVLACDSSGFTRRTHDYGVLHFLAAMNAVFDLFEPYIARGGGCVINRGADNLMAVFSDPAKAVDAALGIQKRLVAFNRGKHDRDQFYLCIGLHHGKVLRLKDGVFGERVNVAAKVGEDLASSQEILVTREVASRLPARLKAPYARTAMIGGRSFELHAVRYPLD